MQLTGLSAVDLWQLQLVHEFQDEIVSRMQVIEGKVPVDRGLQFSFVDPFGDPCDLANANEAAIADNPGQKGFFRQPSSSLLDIPRLEGIDKTSQTVDRREDFNQRDVVLVGQESSQGFALFHLGFRCGEMERTIFVAVEM